MGCSHGHEFVHEAIIPTNYGEHQGRYVLIHPKLSYLRGLCSENTKLCKVDQLYIPWEAFLKWPSIKYKLKLLMLGPLMVFIQI